MQKHYSNKLFIIFLMLFVSVLTSVAGLLVQFYRASLAPYIATSAEAIEVGIIWGIFIGMFFVPILMAYNKQKVFIAHPIKSGLVLMITALVNYFVNPILFYLSQVA
ncbi:hypothetical protein Q4519_20280 [Motilimonas sp. 1_MG-2023]|uniref:hypothetical protein n=1 Tax=Motilimonas sp. 1_MG-2023 TaxID=3062672 RepID=UPI0026E147E2|nr:hypothetical protein [Motilimonas sp. 1_MG-2023]MDO6528016.1 hypothetical protein [Motilimonas sp. 1_MG-2023]